MDLIRLAPRAVWSSGAGRLIFGGIRDDPRGFAIHPPELLLEDGSSQALTLETHPRWRPDGWIRGEFHLPFVTESDQFHARFGFFMPQGPPQTNGVVIAIACDGRPLARFAKRYTQRLDETRISLSSFAGQARTLSVEVHADGESTQDWLAWTVMTVGSEG
jgi:hypothetical protein